MKLIFSAAMSAALAAGITIAALAQTPSQSQTPAGSSATAQQEQQVTVVGCVQREADYRRAQDAGRGGVAGTGAGAGNEFVLANAAMSTPGTAGAPGATGTTGTTGTAYELTGTNEGQVASYVGRRVEITGKLKAAETGAAGRPTGGATAGPPPAGVDVTSKDLKLRELEVSSVREASGTCPAQ